MTPLYRLLFNFPAPGRAAPASRRLCGAQSRHGLAREIRSPWPPPPHTLDWGGYDALVEVLASELGGDSAMHHFDRPSRNRSRPRLIPLRPYSVMVFFSRHSRESGNDGKEGGNDGFRWRTGRGGES